jgi:hypothetical protein
MIYAVYGYAQYAQCKLKILVDSCDLVTAVHDVVDLNGEDFILLGAFIDTDWFPLQTLAAEPLPQAGLRHSRCPS